MNNFQTRISIGAAACILAAMPTASAAPTSADVQSAIDAHPGAASAADPGRELQDAQQRMEQERIQREMQEQQKHPGGTIEHEQPETPQQAGEARFVLQSVTVDASELLPDDVVKASYADAVGKEISIDDLYAIVQKLNDWYAAHHYLTCRAYLPPQTIHAGAVHIALIEGKNGDMTITGNRSTRAGYIKDRLDVKAGEIEDMSKLQKHLDWFNGTNDVKIHITLQAGKAPGTTDYVIRAQEPRRDTWSLYTDHAGSKTTGRYRVFSTRTAVSLAAATRSRSARCTPKGSIRSASAMSSPLAAAVRASRSITARIGRKLSPVFTKSGISPSRATLPIWA